VRPALSKQNYIPALQHVSFAKGYATAYNDISAISVRLESDIDRCIQGELLIRALQSFGAETVMFQQKDEEVVVSSGRSKLKLPTLPNAGFPLQWPEEGDVVEVKLSAAIIRGIERCLMSVGNDPTHPEQMGVTLDSVDGYARLFSTDNFTISSYETDTKLKLPADAPVILPTFFCEQLSALASAYKEEKIVLYVHGGALVAEFGTSARLLTKTLVEREPADFPAMLKKHLKVGNLKKELVSIPAAFDAALQRALLVLESEADKVTSVTLNKEDFRLSSSSSMGEADDKLPFEGDMDFGAPEEIHIDPTLVARASKACGLMGFLPKGLVLADSEAQFVHLVAYCSK
jgi:DNA polymerase III sliding clamp (beta) subunit (PCNA family)